MIRFVYLLLGFTFFSYLSGTEVINLNEESETLNISKSMYYFEDKEKKLGIEEVSNFEFESKFLLHESESINFGYSQDTYWFRFDIINNYRQTKEWLLEIAYPNLDLVEFYSFENEIWKKQIYGDTIPFLNRKIFSRFFVIPLELNSENRSRFYVKVKTSTVVILPIYLHKRDSYIEKISKQETWFAFFYGAMAVMVFYNGFIAISVRSNRYLLYSFATFFTLLFYLAFNGHGFQYIWGKSIWWQNHCVPISTSLAWLFMLSFTNSFLELRNRFFMLNRICFFIQCLFVFAGFYLFISVQQSIMIQNFLALSSATFIFISGVISLKSGYRAARFFVIAWLTFLIGVILFTLYILRVLDANFITTQTIHIGSLLELILLSFALADRYHIIQSESIKVQQELLSAERRITDTLETKVKERTIELDESLKIIKDDLALAKKIQSATLQSKLDQNDKLEVVVRYIAMSEVGGDFYSVDKLDDSTLRIFLADATGHGIQAALIMMAIQGIYDSIKNFALPVNEIMEIFGKEYVRRYGSLNSFLTCFLVDIDTNNEQITYSSAGHPAGLLIGNDKNIELLKNTGGLIGVNPKNTYSHFQFPFKREDKLFIFTDGIFEEFIGEEEFGEERLYELLINNTSNNISNSLDLVLSELEKFLGNTKKQDDITLIGVGYHKI